MNSALARFLGGSPLAVAVRLIVVSFVVGFLLNAFGIDPQPSSRKSSGQRATSSNMASRTCASSAASS